MTGSSGIKGQKGRETGLGTSESLGKYLRQVRLQRNVSLKEISEATGISEAILKALEDEDRDQLPAEVYIKAFYKKYAEYLGLEPQEMVAKYHLQAMDLKKTDRKANFNTVITLKGQAENLFAETLRRLLLPVAILVLGILLYLIYKNYLTPYNFLGFYQDALQPVSSLLGRNYPA